MNLNSKIRCRCFLVVTCGWHTSVWAATATTPGMGPALIAQWLGGLVLVLALIFLSSWGLKKINRLSSPLGEQMRLLGGISLGGREKLMVVEVGEIQLVLGVAPGRVQTLHVLEGGQRLQAREARFAGQLQQMMNQGAGK